MGFAGGSHGPDGTSVLLLCPRMSGRVLRQEQQTHGLFYTSVSLLLLRHQSVAGSVHVIMQRDKGKHQLHLELVGGRCKRSDTGSSSRACGLKELGLGAFTCFLRYCSVRGQTAMQLIGGACQGTRVWGRPGPAASIASPWVSLDEN